MKVYLCLLLFLICSSNALAIDIPTNLKKSDLETVIEVLSFNTSMKALTDPFPLGGYSGLEVGVGAELVDITDLSRIGSSTKPQEDLKYPKLSIGKGLYNDIDLFFSFIPYNEGSALSEYGGMIKWGVFQAEYLPLSISILSHVSLINFNDQFTSQAFGIEGLMGVNVNDFALYFGGGSVQTKSTFISTILDGSDTSIVLSTDNTYRQSVSKIHTFVGIKFGFQSLFAAFQIDRYEQPVYSAKIGVRL